MCTIILDTESLTQQDISQNSVFLIILSKLHLKQQKRHHSCIVYLFALDCFMAGINAWLDRMHHASFIQNLLTPVVDCQACLCLTLALDLFTEVGHFLEAADSKTHVFVWLWLISYHGGRDIIHALWKHCKDVKITNKWYKYCSRWHEALDQDDNLGCNTLETNIRLLHDFASYFQGTFVMAFLTLAATNINALTTFLD